MFGAARKTFRSPYGQKSAPRTNVLWGVSNLLGATLILLALSSLNYHDSYSLGVLLVGFWLTMLMFGTGIKRFLNE